MLAAALLLLPNKLSTPFTDLTRSHNRGLSHGEGGAGNKAQVSNLTDKAYPLCNVIMDCLLCDHVTQS